MRGAYTPRIIPISALELGEKELRFQLHPTAPPQQGCMKGRGVSGKRVSRLARSRFREDRAMKGEGAGAWAGEGMEEAEKRLHFRTKNACYYGERGPPGTRAVK